MRSPRIQGRPPITAGSCVIRSSNSTDEYYHTSKALSPTRSSYYCRDESAVSGLSPPFEQRRPLLRKPLQRIGRRRQRLASRRPLAAVTTAAFARQGALCTLPFHLAASLPGPDRASAQYCPQTGAKHAPTQPAACRLPPHRVPLPLEETRKRKMSGYKHQNTSSHDTSPHPLLGNLPRSEESIAASPPRPTPLPPKKLVIASATANRPEPSRKRHPPHFAKTTSLTKTALFSTR